MNCIRKLVSFIKKRKNSFMLLLFCLPFIVYITIKILNNPKLSDEFINYALLEAEPNSNIKNGQTVQLSWRGIENPSYTDRIGLSCQLKDSSDKIIRLYKIFRQAKSVKSSGKKSVTIFYARGDCIYKYLKLNTNKIYYPLIQSSIVKFSNRLDEAMQIHISLTNHEDQMRIMWVSGSDAEPCVKFGTMGRFEYIQCGNTTTYQADDMCEPPATTTGYINPGFFHSVLLSGLSENTQYFYRVGRYDNFGETYSFLTRRFFKKNEFLVSIIIFGDLGVEKISGPYKTINCIRNLIDTKQNVDMILHVGDISYARGNGYIWEEFGFIIQKVATQIPYMVSIGNHEHLHKNGHEKDPSGRTGNFIPEGNINYGSGGECSVPMVHRFHMPDTGNKLFWYSFDYGIVHIIMLSSEKNFTENSNQYDWLQFDLKSIDRSKTPWVIVTMHRPMYSSSKTGSSRISRLIQKNLEALLLKHKVNFFFNGHVHFYERTCAINNSSCKDVKNFNNNWGINYFTVGSGGKLNKEKIPIHLEWSKKILFLNGIGKIDFLNKTHASWKFIASKNEKILDEVLFVAPQLD